MLFTSLTFLVFFLVIFIIYYLPFSHNIQVPIVIIASLIFYSWNAPFLFVLLALSIAINTITSFKIASSYKQQKQLFWLTLGVIANLCILGFFKYGILLANFFSNRFHISQVFTDDIVNLILQLPTPIGLSFYTFLGISLLADIYHKQNIALEETNTNNIFRVSSSFGKHFLKTTFFIAFFPSLISGPISRAKNFYPQIATKYFKKIPWYTVIRALIIGYFLKMVIADNLKDYTYWIDFPYYQALGTITNLVLLFGYSMQIFADFAGYSLIAIGLAAALGYTLPQNFNFPYISLSLSEFWRRWHISLSTWLRDYLYIPLGGNKKGKIRTYINLIVVMTLGGLWHGATWNYAVWGFFHGFGLAAERLFGTNKKSPEIKDRAKPFWQYFLLDLIRLLTVFSFVSLGWVFFKLPTFNAAVDFLITLTRNINQKLSLELIVPVTIFSLPIIVSHILHFSAFNERAANGLTKIMTSRASIDLILGIMLALVFLDSGSTKAFIYFQF